MDYDIPTDPINKSQIGFRELAGLSTFNPTNTTTVESIIPTTLQNNNSSNSRCKYCQGKLLRNLHSLVCIYCGEFQKHDVHPDPIHFNSTGGYSWLLQSLYFNGSERVGSLAEGSGINGAQSPAEDELTLSELLDLQILWRDEPKKPDNNMTSESSMNLGSADLDFSIESKRDIVSNVPEEQPVASKNDQNKAFKGQENRTSVTSTVDPTDDASSDWNAEFQFADTKMENENPESVDLFVGAEPDLSSHMDAVSGEMEGFNSKRPNDESDPFPSIGKDSIQDDLFANTSSATFQQAKQLDSVVQANDGLSGHLSDDNSKGVDGDWFSDDNWQKSEQVDQLGSFDKLNDGSSQDNPNDSSTDWFENTNRQNSTANTTAVSQQADQLDLFNKLNDGSSQDNPNDSSTDRFENTDWQKSTANITAVPQQADQFDLFDKLNDGSSQDNPNDSSTDWFENTDWQKSTANNTAVSQQADQLELVSKVIDGSSQENPNDSSTDWFENTDWQKSTANNNAVSQQADQLDLVGKLNVGSSQDTPNDSSLDWFENTSWQKSTSKNTAPIIDDNLFDIKPQIVDQVSSSSLVNDSICSENSGLDNLNKHHSDTTTDWFQDSQWPIGASSSTTNMVASKDIDDGFDEWNDFTSSTGNQDSWKQSSNEKVGATDNMPELNLFQSTADPQVDFGDMVANKDGDDGFDEWNNFTSSTGYQDSFPDSRKESSNEKAGATEKISELNLFPSSANPKVDFGDFFQSDLFSGSSSNKIQNDIQAVYDIFSEVSTTSRNANAEAGNRVGGSKNDEITPNATKSPKDDVQMLLSQMHDLSFMLKSELSIPSKPDDLDPSHNKG